MTTRDEPGRLDSLLAAEGADVIHVPLIEITGPADEGRELDDALGTLDGAAWLVVTSRHGARRVAAAAARHPAVRLAAVGTATARVLERSVGRRVDLVPDRQTAADLVAMMPSHADHAEHELVVVAQADRADATLAEGLTARGWTVRAVTAYATRLRMPTPAERAAALRSDALAFASGSAATAWAEAIGSTTPPVVVAIGPTTAAVASDAGLQITHVAADHTVEGLAEAVVNALATRP